MTRPHSSQQLRRSYSTAAQAQLMATRSLALLLMLALLLAAPRTSRSSVIALKEAAIKGRLSRIADELGPFDLWC